MIWLLKLIFLGHVHHWKEDSRIPMDFDLGWKSGRGTRVHCTCEKCGRPAKFDLF